MNTDKHGWRRLALSFQLSALSFLISGCNVLPQPETDTVRHFTLSGPATASADGATVRTVQLAGHLRGRVMAVRVAPNEVIYNEDVRWAESLDEAITLLLRARVGAAGAGQVVTVQIQRCELVKHEGNSVQFAATYAITAADGTVKRGSFSASPRTWEGGDNGVLVGQIRDAVGEFGDALVAALEGK
jgi:hypothetical protein